MTNLASKFWSAIACSTLWACHSDTPPHDAEGTSVHWSCFGDSIQGYEDRIPAHAATNVLNETGEASGIFEAQIVQSCSTLGCWMSIVGPSDDTTRVYMKDHAFFLPKNGLEGKTTYFAGKAFYDTTSVELQKRILEGAGAAQEKIDAVQHPVFTLTFEAAGVMIEDGSATELPTGDAD